MRCLAPMHRALLGAACCFVAAATGLLAQSSLNQQISGHVLDGAGAAVPNVTFTVVNQDTALMRTVKTNETGNYVVSDLPTGKYKVTAEMLGFKTEVVNDNELSTNVSIEVNIKMQVGNVSESVTAQADVVHVEMANGDLGYTVTSDLRSEIQLN